MNIPRPQFHTDMLDGERVYWCSLGLMFHIDDKWPTIEIPSRFVSDGFSIPKGLRAFFSTAPASLPAAVLHDWLYAAGTPKHCMSRRGVDKYFRELLKAYGVGLIRRNAIYAGVRMGGWTCYNKTPPLFKKP